MGGFKVSYPTLYGVVDTLPATGATGQMVFNIADNNLYVYYSGAWHVVGSGASDGPFDFMDGTDFQFMDGTNANFMAS